MGFSVQTVVGPQKLVDGPYPNSSLRQATDGGLYIQQAHGKYYEQAIRGNIYYDSIPVAGIVIAVAGSGNVASLIFNPLGLFVVVEQIRAELTYISGANVPGGFAYYQVGPSSGAATGGLIATLVTPAAPVNANVGNTPVKSAAHQFYVGASTFAATPTYLKASRMSLFTGAAATAWTPFMLWEDFDGGFNVPSGYAVQFCSAQANATGKFSGTWTVLENSWTQPSS